MTLLEHVHCIVDKDHIEGEHTYFVKTSSLKNGFSLVEIKRTFACFDSKRSEAPMEREEEPIRGVAVVPFYHTTMEKHPNDVLSFI